MDKDKRDGVFSVIIPTFQNLDLFRNALSSVLTQEKVPVDIIVVDDSTDDTIKNFVEVLADERITYYRNEPPLGAVRNWNKGLKQADGDYILLMHHDEALQNPYHLRCIVDQMQRGYDVLVCDVMVSKDGIVSKHKFSNHLLKRLFLCFPILLFGINAIGPCACVAFKKEKMICFDEKLRWLVDVEWYYRLQRKAKVGFLNKNCQVLSCHGHTGQITQQINVASVLSTDSDIINLKYNNDWTIKLMLKLQRMLINTKQVK